MGPERLTQRGPDVPEGRHRLHEPARQPLPNFRWAIYYEPEGYGDPSVSTIEADLNYIRTNYATQPSYLRVDGKPVVFVYNAKEADASSDYWQNDLSRWTQVRNDMAAADTPFYISMKDDPLWVRRQPERDGLLARLRARHRLRHRERVLLLGQPGLLEGTGRAAAGPRPDQVRYERGVDGRRPGGLEDHETWNEWHEGTSVEPGAQWNWAYDSTATTSSPASATPVAGGDFGDTYADALGCRLPALQNGLGDNGANGYTVPAPTCQ